MTVQADLDLARHMEAVARELLGAPNPDMSRGREWRFGSHGSLSIDLDRGVWHDHETGAGGGVLDLIRRETGRTNGAALDWLRERGVIETPRHDAPRADMGRKIVAAYDYCDEAGALLFQAVRLSPKTFRQRRPDGRGGWQWSTKGVRRVLYRLPELLAAPTDAPVFVCEGEKDADRLAALGMVATTNAEGAGKWRDDYAAELAGRRAVILADNDDAGRAHAAAVLASLRRAGVDAAVLDLPGLPIKGDVSDWLDAGGDPAELRRMADAALAETPGDDASGITPTPFTLRDPATIPPRRWLYGRHLIAGFVSLTVSPGGLGKSSLALAEALAMAAGRNLIGDAPPQPLRVWYWCGEDPAEEIDRRVTAACMHYGITAADLDGRLFTDSGRVLPITLASEERGGVIIARPQVEAMVAAINAAGLDVLIIDPFVTSHGVNENDNRAINAVVSLWREIADRTGCAVELIHHAQKAAINAGAELGVAQSRGASALIDGVRSARFLVGMTEDEAARAGLDTHQGFFRVEMGKANLAPRPDRAVWRRMVNVALGNGSRLYPEGDHVGVATAWEWPDAFDGVTVETLNAVKARLASGDWKASDKADRWAGHVVADVLGLDAGPVKKAERTPAHNAARAKVRAMLTTWLRNGELIEETRRDERTRRDTPFIVPAGGDDN